ncbi:MAG: hypothetical protein GY754_30875 [bacterium]|nr:hypothetical protein [bacterium]
MTLEELIHKEIKAEKIDSISNEEYKKICSEKKSEIEEILRGYTEAVKNAFDYYVR